MIPGIEQIVKQSCLAGVENIFLEQRIEED